MTVRILTLSTNKFVVSVIIVLHSYSQEDALNSKDLHFNLIMGNEAWPSDGQ